MLTKLRALAGVLLLTGFSAVVHASTIDFTNLNLAFDPHGINNSGQIVGFEILNNSSLLRNPDGSIAPIQFPEFSP